MCYVIAKDRYGHGCIAFETVHGKHLADLKWSLDEALGNTGVEIMTISAPKPMASTHLITLCKLRKSL